MQPKTAIIILLTLAILIALFFTFLYFKQQSDIHSQQPPISDKSDNTEVEQVSPENMSSQQALINQKIQQIRQELNKKSQEEIKSQGYTQEEIDFIPSDQPYSQEEIDAILNPEPTQ